MKAAHDWLSFFAVRWREKNSGRHYGKGESDAKACARLGDELASLPDEQRIQDWEARERIVAEFLGSADRATVAAGWSFAFFAAAFRGLCIPPNERAKPDWKPERADGSRSGPKPFRWPELKVPQPRKATTP